MTPSGEESFSILVMNSPSCIEKQNTHNQTPYDPVADPLPGHTGRSLPRDPLWRRILFHSRHELPLLHRKTKIHTIKPPMTLWPTPYPATRGSLPRDPLRARVPRSQACLPIISNAWPENARLLRCFVGSQRLPATPGEGRGEETGKTERGEETPAPVRQTGPGRQSSSRGTDKMSVCHAQPGATGTETQGRRRSTMPVRRIGNTPNRHYAQAAPGT